MKEEVKRILTMVQDGKIDLDKASDLIEAINKSSDTVPLSISKNLGIDIKMIMEAIDSGLEGKIVDVKSGDGDIIEVSIE